LSWLRDLMVRMKYEGVRQGKTRTAREVYRDAGELQGEIEDWVRTAENEREKDLLWRLHQIPVLKNLGANLTAIKNLLGNSGDLDIRTFVVGARNPVRCALVFVEGMSDKHVIRESILKPLMHLGRQEEPSRGFSSATAFEVIRDFSLSAGDVEEVRDIREVLNSVLSGDSALFVEGEPRAMIVASKGFKHRSITEPDTETIIRGPREAFVEAIRVNTSLTRRRLKTHNLRVDEIKVGYLSETKVAVLYVKGLAQEDLVREVKDRLGRIQTDTILDSGYLEDYIEDHPFSPFPQVQNTERPDKVAAALAEGRVAILADGSPFALIVPTTFHMFLQAPEDYYERPHIAVLLRSIRWFSLVLALVFPSFYVAATTFHQEMIPTSLALSIAAGRQGVPFPAVVEALTMEVLFEILREAGVRLPRMIGNAISIVGALVLGQAAVAAGIVSPIMVIVVGVTAIASFVVPAFSAAISVRILRFPMMVFAASLGLYGVMWFSLLIMIHLVSMRSFGVAYLSPMAPLQVGNLKDFYVRVPWWAMYTRPKPFGRRDPKRAELRQKPGPPTERP